MEGTITKALLSSLLLYKYAALFLIECISALGLPVPSAAAMVASGVFASQGYFSLSLVLLVGFLGNIIGDISLFFLARRLKLPILRFLRIKEFGNSGLIGKIEGFLSEHSGWTIALSRLSGSGSPAVSALAGISAVEPWRFIAFATIGEITFTLGYAFIGYFIGVEWEDISGFAVPVGLIAIAAAAIFIAARNRKRKA